MTQTQIVGAIKIKDGLFIGDEYAAQDREFIITNKVTHIVNCAGTQVTNKWTQMGVRYLTFNWLENDQEVLFDDKGDNVNRIYVFMEECFQQGESCLVHSVRGQSRACCVLAGYFMKKYSWTLYKTLEYLNSRRPDLEIRASFFYQLNTLEAKMAKLGNKRTASWNELTADDTDVQQASEELIIRNTFLNSHNGPVDDIYTNLSIKLNTLNRNSLSKLKWRDQTNKENLSLATIVYNGPPDFIPVREQTISKEASTPILKGGKKKSTQLAKPPQVQINIHKSQQSLSTQSNSQVRSVSSKSQAESQETTQNGGAPLNNILSSNPSLSNLLLNCTLKSRTPSQQENIKKPPQPLVNNFTKPPLQQESTIRSNSLQQYEEKKQEQQPRTNSLKQKDNSVLTNFQEFKNQVQQSLNYFNKQYEALHNPDDDKKYQQQFTQQQSTQQTSIPQVQTSLQQQQNQQQYQQSKLDQLISPTVLNNISSTKHSDIQKTLTQSISQLQSSYQKFQQLQIKSQQAMKSSQSTTQIPKDSLQSNIDINSINKTTDLSNIRMQQQDSKHRPNSAEVKEGHKSLSKDKKDNLSPFAKEVKPMRLQQGPPLPQSSSQLYLRNVQCRRQAASTLRNQQKPNLGNNSFQDKYLNNSANNQVQNSSFNNNSNSQIDNDSKGGLLKQFAQQTISDGSQFKKLVSPQNFTKSQTNFTKNQPIKVLQDLTDKTPSQKQMKPKENASSMSFTLVPKPATQSTRTFSPAVKVDQNKLKGNQHVPSTQSHLRHKIRNSSPGMPKDQDSSSSIQNNSGIQLQKTNWKVL